MHLLDDKVCFYCGEKRLCVRFQDDGDVGVCGECLEQALELISGGAPEKHRNWKLGLHLGTADLEKARWYLDRHIQNLKKAKPGMSDHELRRLAYEAHPGKKKE